MDKALLYEHSRGWEPLDVSLEDRGFDILSRNPVSGDVRLSCTAWMGASCKDRPLSCGCRYNITVVKIDHYHVGADIILQQGMKDEK